MYSKCWEIIRDDQKRTFEVCGQETNNNHFTNAVHGMQKLGMHVTGMTPPVSGQYSNQDSIKIAGYSKETGLFRRLMKEYRDKIAGDLGSWEE